MAAARSASITLINHPICPFGARAHIASVLHLGDRFTMKETSLTEKPAWFTETYHKALGADPSSTGKVPVLDDNGFIICESAIVAEYIDRKYGSDEARLIPSDPAELADAQLFISSFEDRVIKGFYKLLMAKPEDRPVFAADRDKLVEEMNAALLARDARAGSAGPFFGGDHFGWVEVMLYPWFGRGAALKVHRGWEVKETESTARFRAWLAACAAHPAVAATSKDDEYYATGYTVYAEKGDA